MPLSIDVVSLSYSILVPPKDTALFFTRYHFLWPTEKQPFFFSPKYFSESLMQLRKQELTI